MMVRRAFISGITLGLLAAPLAGEAQEAAKIARIGYLTADLAANPHRNEVLRQGFRKATISPRSSP